MGANESTRQACSTDTNLDNQLVSDGFAVRKLCMTFYLDLNLPYKGS